MIYELDITHKKWYNSLAMKILYSQPKTGKQHKQKEKPYRVSGSVRLWRNNNVILLFQGGNIVSQMTQKVKVFLVNFFAKKEGKLGKYPFVVCFNFKYAQKEGILCITITSTS